MPKILLCLISFWTLLPVFALPDTTGANQLFFRGPEYTKIVAVSSGSPYLYEDVPGLRRVHYYGQWFSGVELHYDAEDDLLMTREAGGAIRMSLVKEKVTSFYLGPKQFNFLPGVGFCEVIYGGLHSVWVKWEKVLVRIGVEDPTYRTYQRVFVSDKGVMVEVSGKKDLVAILGKQGKKAVDLARPLKLDYKKAFPAAAAGLMEYADQNHLYE